MTVNSDGPHKCEKIYKYLRLDVVRSVVSVQYFLPLNVIIQMEYITLVLNFLQFSVRLGRNMKNIFKKGRN